MYKIGSKVHIDDTYAEPSGRSIRAVAAVAVHVFAQHTQFSKTDGRSCDSAHVQIHGKSGFDFSFTTGD